MDDDLRIVNAPVFAEELKRSIRDAEEEGGRHFAVAKFNREIQDEDEKHRADLLMSELIPTHLIVSHELVIELSDQLDIDKDELEYRIIK